MQSPAEARWSFILVTIMVMTVVVSDLEDYVPALKHLLVEEHPGVIVLPLFVCLMFAPRSTMQPAWIFLGVMNVAFMLYLLCGFRYPLAPTLHNILSAEMLIAVAFLIVAVVSHVRRLVA